MIPPLGPLKDLWVLVDTTWQNGNGEGCNSAAIIPELWQISPWRTAPTSSATSLNFSNSTVLGYALAPHIIILGLNSFAFLSKSSKSTNPVSFFTSKVKAII